MHVLLTGAAGMIGRKIAERLVGDGHVGGREIRRLTLFDVVSSDMKVLPAVRIVTGDIADPTMSHRLVEERPDIILHVAAIVSGEAEADFEKGYRINLDASRALFEAIRGVGDGYRPRVVFASSTGVYGAPFPEVIPDDFHLTPQTSYGAQKVIIELLLSDYTRRGIIDGIGLRLPTIVVRPGKPNLAVSGFFSSIVREPLAGREAILPVPTHVRHFIASPRSAVGFFLHAATLDGATLGNRRNFAMPGLSVTVAEMIEGLRKVAGGKAVSLIRHQRDPKVEAMVLGWPRALDARTARDLGFRAETAFEDIVRAYIEDELEGRLPID